MTHFESRPQKNNKNRISYYLSKSFQDKWLKENINCCKEFNEMNEEQERMAIEEGDAWMVRRYKLLKHLNSNINEMKYVNHNEIMTLQIAMEVVINYLKDEFFDNQENWLLDKNDPSYDKQDEKTIRNRLRMTKTAKKSLARYTDKFLSYGRNIDNYKY